MRDFQYPGSVRRAESLAALRARVSRIERAGPVVRAGQARDAVLTFGVPEVDAVLPGGGLALDRVHEIVGEGRSEIRDVGCFGFVAALLARLSAVIRDSGRRHVIWCHSPANRFAGRAHGRGLASQGIDPDRIIWVAARDRAERLWAMEQALACSGVMAAVIELEGNVGVAGARRDVTERRLQLAAETGGVPGFLLSAMGRGEGGGGVLETRWRVQSTPSPHWMPAWRVDLRRARGGGVGEWSLGWDGGTGSFRPITPQVIARETHGGDAILGYAG